VRRDRSIGAAGGARGHRVGVGWCGRRPMGSRVWGWGWSRRGRRGGTGGGGAAHEEGAGVLRGGCSCGGRGGRARRLQVEGRAGVVGLAEGRLAPAAATARERAPALAARRCSRFRRNFSYRRVDERSCPRSAGSSPSAVTETGSLETPAASSSACPGVEHTRRRRTLAFIAGRLGISHNPLSCWTLPLARSW
jgi:hypothetical protein